MNLIQIDRVHSHLTTRASAPLQAHEGAPSAGNTKWIEGTEGTEGSYPPAHFRPLSPLRSTKSTWYHRPAIRELTRAKSWIDKLHRRLLGLPDRVFAPEPCEYLRLPSA